MKRRIAALVIAASAVAIVWLSQRSHDHAPTLIVTNRAPTTGTTLPTKLARSVPTALMPPRESYKSQVDRSKNYWQLAHGILKAANSGDPDAQLYLSRMLAYCKEKNEFWFQKRGQKLSLDEGSQLAAQRHLPVEIAQEVYEKCHDFMENDASELGNSGEWLAKATTGGQPLAQATTAMKMVMQKYKSALANAGGVSDPDSSDPIGIGNGADPAGLLRAAVQSGDPEVLFDIGEILPLLSPNIDTKIDRLSWQLLACESGFDCSANADWVKLSCGSAPVCASATGPSDIVRHLAGDDWFNVQLRASEISSMMAAGKWSELGLGS
jgi:hypothetical protein